MAKWKTPTDLKYTKNDEWVRIEGNTGTLGVTDYAQEQLNDIVFVELPSIGAKLGKGESFGVIESVKAASDAFMPIGGTITEVNNALEGEPELINTDPFGAGWILKFTVTNSSDADDLMDAEAYAAYCESR